MHSNPHSTPRTAPHAERLTALAGTEGALVEQAKGVLMLQYGVSAYESLAALARWAREAEVTISDLARALVKGVCQGRDEPDDRFLVRWLEHRLRTDLVDSSRGSRSEERRTTGPTGRPQRRDAAAGRNDKRWRYASAVHAARAINTQ